MPSIFSKSVFWIDIQGTRGDRERAVFQDIVRCIRSCRSRSHHARHPGTGLKRSQPGPGYPASTGMWTHQRAHSSASSRTSRPLCLKRPMIPNQLNFRSGRGGRLLQKVSTMAFSVIFEPAEASVQVHICLVTRDNPAYRAWWYYSACFQCRDALSSHHG
jgi:hypothetical protein